MSLDISTLSLDQRPTGAWAAALLLAVAREEAVGRRPHRVTETGLATWGRFRGRLKAKDLLELIFEDAAVIHPVPFDPARVDEQLQLQRLPDEAPEAWLSALPSIDLNAPGAVYLVEQARLLGVSSKLARSDLHVVKAHQKVLELPSTGGQLAHHLVSTHPELTLQGNFTLACGSWQELTLAGIVALDLGAPHTDFIVGVEPEQLRNPDHALRRRSFDFVIGLHPDKGGLFQAANQLAIWFPAATILLV